MLTLNDQNLWSIAILKTVEFWIQVILQWWLNKMLNISEDKRFMRSFKICLPSHCAPGVNWDHRCRFRTLYGPTLLSILTCTDVHNSCPLILCGFLTQKDRQTIIFRLGLVKFKLTTVGLRLPLFLRVSLIWATESIQLDVCLRSLWTCLG